MNAKHYTTVKFYFSKEALEHLKKLTERIKVSTRAETIHKALRFYEYSISMIDKGYIVEFNKPSPGCRKGG